MAHFASVERAPELFVFNDFFDLASPGIPLSPLLLDLPGVDVFFKEPLEVIAERLVKNIRILSFVISSVSGLSERC